MEKIKLTEAQYQVLAKYGNVLLQDMNVQLGTTHDPQSFIKSVRAKIVDHCRTTFGFWMLEEQLQNVFKRMSETRLNP
jgi:hypothetical protein